MAQLIGGTGRAAAPGDSPDDLSNRTQRQLIGLIGLLLPLVLVLLAALRPTQPLARWRLQGSISAYYYTGAVAAFVGLLVALALFLLSYHGYNNRYRAWDRISAVVAGVAALCVAFFPTAAPEGFTAPPWWTPLTGKVHAASAVVLFSSFAFFSLWLFRRTDPGQQPAADKRWRNTVYLVCGSAILVSIVLAGLNGWQGRSIFFPESSALFFFAISWLVKGKAQETVKEAGVNLATSLRRMLTRPDVTG